MEILNDIKLVNTKIYDSLSNSTVPKIVLFIAYTLIVDVITTYLGISIGVKELNAYVKDNVVQFGIFRVLTIYMVFFSYYYTEEFYPEKLMLYKVFSFLAGAVLLFSAINNIFLVTYFILKTI